MTTASRRTLTGPRALWLILGASLLGRTLFATLTPLIPDEAYAIAVGRSFSLSFFDHPPLGFWLPAIAERLGAGSPLAYRLPSLVLGTISISLLYLIGRDLAGTRAGLWSAGLGALTPTLAASGTFILPDAPLDVFTLATLLILLRISRADEPEMRLWGAGGCTLALAFCSKYQAGLLPISVLAWMTTSHAGRGWFRRRGFYLAVLVALLGLLPVVLWNNSHDWASFRFQSGRAGHALSPVNFAVMALGQTFYLLPVILIWSIREGIDQRNWSMADRRLIVMVALGPILMFNAIYFLSRGTLPHWSMPGWICLLPLVGARVAQSAGSRAKVLNFAIAGAVYAALLGVAMDFGTGWATWFSARDPAWDRTAPSVSLTELRSTLQRSGVLAETDVVVTDGWIQAGYIAAALGERIPVRVYGDAHHFAYLPGARATGSGLMLMIVDAPDAAGREEKLIAEARTIDPSAVVLPEIPLRRGSEDHFRILMIRLRVRNG